MQAALEVSEQFWAPGVGVVAVVLPPPPDLLHAIRENDEAARIPINENDKISFFIVPYPRAKHMPSNDLVKNQLIRGGLK